MNLLQKALSVKIPQPIAPRAAVTTEDQLDLVDAWIAGKITHRQAIAALKTTGVNYPSFTTWASLRILAAYKMGMLVRKNSVDKPKSRRK